MIRLKRLYRILKITGMTKILIGFVFFLMIISFILTLVEPDMHRFVNALWYCFCAFTTMGFGDFYAVTMIGRICTVLIGIYGILIIALIPGVLVSYYLEFMNKKAKDTISVFFERLEHLEDLSKEELQDISKKVKENRYRL